MRRLIGSEDGFSMLEVLFSAFIAFIVLTAIFGLLANSARVAKVGNVETVATALGTQLIEQARAADYDSVGTTTGAGGGPVGQYPSDEVVVSQGYSFNVHRDITWISSGGNPQAYKWFVLLVNWAGGGQGLRFETYISEHTQAIATTPTVAWVAGVVPPDNAVIFDNGANTTNVWGGVATDPNGIDSAHSPVTLEASASILGTSGVLTSLVISVDGTTLVSYPLGSTHFVNDSPPYLVDASSDASPTLDEGTHEFRATATNNGGTNVYALKYLVVDNLPPTWTVSSVNATAPVYANDPANFNSLRYTGAMVVTWTVPYDGLDPAQKYDFYIRVNGSDPATYTWVDMSSTPGTFTARNGTPTGLQMTTSTVSAYNFRLVPRSPRGLTGAPSSWSATAVACPQLNGTIKAPTNNIDFTGPWYVTLTMPTTTTALLNQMWGAGATASWDVWSTSTSGTVSLEQADVYKTTFTSASNKSWTTKYLQVELKIWRGGSVVYRIRSNVIGLPPAVKQGQNFVAIPVTP